jgi:FtsP/CotA-like multicopper oxidase with cupredoxin domain
VRRLLRATAVVLAGAVVVAAVAALRVFTNARTSTAGSLVFDQPLRIPPLLEPRTDGAGRKVFDLRLQAGTTELLPGKPTATWGINGPHLGPTVRASRGDTVLMRVRNTLREATTLHWHGMHLPAMADGGPHQTIAPGQTWTPSWRIEQPAATLWYHPHLMGATEDHVYRGLAGMWIVDDPAAARLELPDTYGVDDIPLIIQDKRLDDAGRLDFGQAAISPIGRLGDDVLVNGTSRPYLPVRHERVRLRLLNGSTARVYDVGFRDDRRFELIASDGGLLERPARLTRIQLSPGERAEIIVDVRPGERAVLRSFPPDLRTDFFNDRFSGGDDTLDLLEIRAADRLAPAQPVPDRLTDLVARETPAASRVRRFELSGSSRINGARMDLGRIDATVVPGATEVWEVSNPGNTPHSFHVHDVRFRVLDPPTPALSGLKDTVYVRPGSQLRLAIRFGDYQDAKHPYMLHCHLLEHEDRGMMGQFVVAR